MKETGVLKKLQMKWFDDEKSILEITSDQEDKFSLGIREVFTLVAIILGGIFTSIASLAIELLLKRYYA